MRQHQFPVEFDKLTYEQLSEVHIWLDDFSYRVTLEKLKAQFGIKITQSKLHRYNQKRELADEICGEEEFQVDMKHWYDLINGNPVPYDQATLKLLSRKMFEYLLNPANKVTAHSLAMLHRLATYETTLDITLRRLALAERKNGINPECRSTSKTVSPAAPQPAPAQTRETPSPTAKPVITTQAKAKPGAKSPAAASASEPEIVFPSALDSIITPLPATSAPPSPALVTQILNQLPRDFAKPKFARVA